MTNTDITTIHWPRSVLFIEELPGKPVTNPAALARIFGITSYLHVIWEEGKLRHKASSSDLNITLAETGASAEQFYADIFAGPQPPEQIFRLRNPVFPLPALFVEEFSNDLPPADYRSPPSQGSAYGMTGFFAARISSEAFLVLNAAPVDLLLPNGCFTGLSLPDGGQPYFSDRLQRHYLLENFELLFESPRMLVVDAVSRCNYACRKCPFHAPSSLLDQREVMPVSQYTRLL